MTTPKVALITGVTGQDGAYLAAQSHVAVSFEEPESPSITARPMASVPAMASRSTMRGRCAARPSSRARSPAPCMAHIALGLQVSVREFVQRAAAELGITVAFGGEGRGEAGTVAAVSGNKAQCNVGDVAVRIDPRYFRPTEIETLLGDPGKAKRKLGWTPATTLAELVSEIVESDYVAAKRDSLVKKGGYQAYDYHE